MEVIKRPQNEIVEPSAELPKWIEELLKLFYDFYQRCKLMVSSSKVLFGRAKRSKILSTYRAHLSPFAQGKHLKCERDVKIHWNTMRCLSLQQISCFSSWWNLRIECLSKENPRLHLLLKMSKFSKSLVCPVFILRCNYSQIWVTLKKNHDFWTSVSSIICSSVCIQKPHRDKKTTLSKQNKSHNIHKSPNPNE